jgi:hypothetical protein
MVSLRSQSGSAGDQAAIQRIFAADLADLPLFAVEAACKDYRLGKAGDGHWMPTQAEIRRVAESYCSSAVEEAKDIRNILTADIIPETTIDENRRRMALERWDRIKSDFTKEHNPHVKRPLSDVTKPEAETNLQRLEAELARAKPPQLSPSLRTKLFGAETTEEQVKEALR